MKREEMSFAGRMRDLESGFAARAKEEGDVYLPNFTPSAPVDAILIAMEPSLGGRPPAEAESRIAAGFRNFMWSPEDFILHYAARRSLCAPGGTYHITHISKGAMTVAKAKVDREARYARWFDLLREEVDLIAKPHARIVAIGREARTFLDEHRFDRDVAEVIHYSPQAGRSRDVKVKGREREFQDFLSKSKLSMDDIVATAEAVMREHSVPFGPFTETIIRLRRATLSESRKKLAFVYVTEFAKLR